MGDDSRTRLVGGLTRGVILALTGAAAAGATSASGGLAAPRFGFVLHDNGEPDGTNGYGNATRNVFGARRTLLDDFVLESPNLVDGLKHYAIWNSLPPGSGTGMEVVIRIDDAGAPGPIIAAPHVTSYREEATGRTMFSRPEYVAWTAFERVFLDPGHYWFEATVVGPENNFWLVTEEIQHGACWVNYEDFGGLGDGRMTFGIDVDLAWSLLGEACGKRGGCCLADGSCVDTPNCQACVDLGGIFQGVARLCGDVECVCRADVDGSGTVGVDDLISILAAWGPCARCPADTDRNGVVDVGDLLSVLSLWGPCV